MALLSQTMARLIYSAIASLDGYVEDADGRFDWAAPSAEAHAFVNGLCRSIETYLYGRRMYETMMVWETDSAFAEESPETSEFAAIWQAAEKIIYSRKLSEASTSRTRIERRFDPGAVRELKAAAGRDLAVAGAELAGEALRAGLVDECHLFLAPVIVGAGKRALSDGVRLNLNLVDERRFADGMVFLRYAVQQD